MPAANLRIVHPMAALTQSHLQNRSDRSREKGAGQGANLQAESMARKSTRCGRLPLKSLCFLNFIVILSGSPALFFTIEIIAIFTILPAPGR
jgi:hypothetical protein